MTSISAVKDLPGCFRKSDAWNQIADFQNYRHIIPHIDAIKILEKNPTSSRTEWFITLDGAPFSWIELDLFVHDQFLVRHEAVNGDFDVFKGEWKIDDGATEGIRLTYSLDFKLGIPVIEENCQDILREKFQLYINSLIEKHSEKLGERAIEERRFKRVAVNRPASLTLDGRRIEAHVLDISLGGMALLLTKGMLEMRSDRPKAAEIKFTTLETRGICHFDENNRIHRIQFAGPLNETDFKAICADLSAGGNSQEDLIKIYEVVTAANGVSIRQSVKSPVG
jgi:ribosome-associated toxin RatA of RatAB toxin-antitoxin module